jgi:Fe-S oxidoreductase
MLPAPENYLSFSGYIVFWALSLVALGCFLQRCWLLVSFLKLGTPENRFDRPAFRLLSMLGLVSSQSTNLKTFTLKDPASVGHALMFWGFGLLGIGYLAFIWVGAGFGIFLPGRMNQFETVYSSIMDIAAFAVVVSMIGVIIKRYLIKPPRLNRKETAGEKITQVVLIAAIIILMFLHYGIEGFRYAAYGIPGSWPPIGMAIGHVLMDGKISQNNLELTFAYLWWINYFLLLATIIYAPRSKHLHPLFSPFNIAFRDLKPKGALKPIDIQKNEEWGASNIRDFTWKQLLDGYACTWCGKCHTACPAQVSGKPLSPRELILGMKTHLLEIGSVLYNAKREKTRIIADESDGAGGHVALDKPGDSLIGSIISEEAIWACTTCGACQEICPSCNEQMSDIIALRRHLQMTAATETAKDVLKNLRVRGNPWRGTVHARTDWAEDLDIKIVEDDSDIDVLYWVGCTEALDDRGIKVSRAFAMLMKKAGINFGILGEEEKCCGDPARRLGAEHLFQMLAMSNIQTFSSYNIKKIVTACPHCFNTLKNEYPQISGRFDVMHHSQFISDLIRTNKLDLSQVGDAIMAYHDACYLGRYNDLYKEPRQILGSIPGATLVEMAQNRKNSFCCGGGGGRMWLEEETGQRISEIRLEHALESQVHILVTACPFCLQMLEDATKTKGIEKSLKIRDIVEIVAEASGIDEDIAPFSISGGR